MPVPSIYPVQRGGRKLIGMHLLIYSKNHLLNQRGRGIKVMEKIPSWMERLLLPKLNEITGEIKAIHTHFSFTVFELTLRAVYQTTGLQGFLKKPPQDFTRLTQEIRIIWG